LNRQIYLAFINGHFPPNWKNLATDLHHCLPFTFEILPLKINLRLFYSTDRNQYHSTLLLGHLLKNLPEQGEKIIGITDVDIYIPILTFLFGEAQLNGRGAVVSTYRLNTKFYGLPRNDQLLYDRTLKEILHELGHTFGLIHCADFECVMNSSTYVENIDLKRASFCQSCQDKMGINCDKRSF
jgi:archaemetzincin